MWYLKETFFEMGEITMDRYPFGFYPFVWREYIYPSFFFSFTTIFLQSITSFNINIIIYFFKYKGDNLHPSSKCKFEWIN